MSNSARLTFLVIHDGPSSTDRMSWPNPYDPKEIEWKLRYAPQTLDRSDQLVAAGLISAYSSLIDLPQKVRNRRVEQIKKALAGEL